jgi:1,4-alpha-glucan branching enzyme
MNGKDAAKAKRKKSIFKKKDSDSRAVEIIFYAPEAKEVFLAGEFNRWDTRSLPMTKDKGGIWKQKIELTPGHYEYKIFVDGTWFEDIRGSGMVPNPFGTHNFVLDVQ